jgi:signal transduction histidine kinase
MEVRVVDTGIGMTRDEVDRIFEDFVRIKNDKTKNISGSGLGLSIIRKLIDKYNGKIEVSSTPDLGSTFIVRFPIEKPCS